MFKLNKPTRTIKGELVVPFLVEGRLVHVIDMNKTQKIVDLSDFDFEKKEKSIKPNIIMVKGTSIINDDEPLFDPQEGGYLGGVYEEKPLVVKPPTTIIAAVETPTINEIPIEIKSEADTSFVVKRVFTHYDGTKLITVIGQAITSYTFVEEVVLEKITKTFEYLVPRSYIKFSGTSIRLFSIKQSFRYLVLIKPIKIIGTAITLKKLPISSNVANDFYGGL